MGDAKEKIVLEKLSIFRGLEPGDPEAFVKDMGGSIQRFLKKERIVYRHDDNPNLGVVVEGAVHIVLTDFAESEVLAYELQADALFGNVWAVAGTETYCGMSVDVRPKTVLLWLPYRSFLAAGTEKKQSARAERVYGIVRRNLLTILSRMMFVMIQKIEVLSQYTLRGRLRLYLFHQAKAQGTDRVKVPSRVELAKMLVCNRSALTREIGCMEDEGVLVCGDGWMQMKDAQKMK